MTDHPVRVRWRESKAWMHCKGQDLREFIPWWELVKALQPQVYLEIGSNEGRSLYLIQDAIAPGCRVISMDVRAISGTHKVPLQRAFNVLAAKGFEVAFVRADSTNPAALNALNRVLGARLVDVLFIDGDHSYAAVQADFTMYRPLVRKNGLIGIHDIAHPFWGPQRLWKELHACHCNQFVATRGMGIGVIRQW